MAQGDHVFYYRHGTIYSHHGIDTGDGTVVHYDSTVWRKLAGAGRWMRCCASDVPVIQEVSWEDFGAQETFLVRPYGWCYDPGEVVARARSRVGEVGYDLFRNNCEHFAVWCKTGQTESSQADAARRAARDWAKSQWVSLALLRTARRLPAPLRPWAYGGALVASGTVLVTHYAYQRWGHIVRRVS